MLAGAKMSALKKTSKVNGPREDEKDACQIQLQKNNMGATMPRPMPSGGKLEFKQV
jgi:hypothetical protein